MGIDQDKGKLSSKREDPYVIQKEKRPRTYKLAYKDEKALERMWHTDNLCKYYL